MSPPIAASTVIVRLDAVEALATELAALADDLSADGALCRSAASSLIGALGREEGWAAGSAATAWAAVTDLVAARAGAVAGTLVNAVVAYRSADLALAGRIGSGRLEPPRGDR